PDVFFPDIPADYWSARPGLRTPSGDVQMSAGGLLVEREDSSVLIDAGVGEMTRQFSFGDVDCGSLVEVLNALGRRPDAIDAVAFTHLHFDHAGWAFTNGAKTFPNARYVMAELEWAPFADGDHGDGIATPTEVISQLASEDIELVHDGDEIVPGVHALV